MPEYESAPWAEVIFNTSAVLAESIDLEILEGLTKKVDSVKIKGVKKIRFDLPIHLTLIDGTVEFIKETPGFATPYLLKVTARIFSLDLSKHVYHEFLVSVNEYGFAHEQAKEPYIANDPLRPPDKEEIYF